ncbi:hypothetical protein HY523_02825 [Candidatus Berkelbacteria bacterium]|nr:hypothetical protein [Candidatus Berkelbacteria bacterium]
MALKKASAPDSWAGKYVNHRQEIVDGPSLMDVMLAACDRQHGSRELTFTLHYKNYRPCDDATTMVLFGLEGIQHVGGDHREIFFFHGRGIFAYTSITNPATWDRGRWDFFGIYDTQKRTGWCQRIEKPETGDVERRMARRTVGSSLHQLLNGRGSLSETDVQTDLLSLLLAVYNFYIAVQKSPGSRIARPFARKMERMLLLAMMAIQTPGMVTSDLPSLPRDDE